MRGTSQHTPHLLNTNPQNKTKLTRLQNPKKQKPTQPRTPQHNEQTRQNLSRITTTNTTLTSQRKRKRNDSQHNKVSAAGEISQFVEMQRPCYAEEKELVGDCDEEGYGKVVAV